MKKKKIAFMLLFFLIFLLAGCSSGQQKTQNQTTSNQEESSQTAKGSQAKKKVVTSFYPIYILALNVSDGVDTIALENLTQPQTGCLHDYQLTTDDMKTLDTAEVLLINGVGMERFLDKAMESNASLEIVDTSKGTNLVESSKDDDQYNAHIWLSIPNAIKQAENIRDCFIRIDPDNEDKYKKNTEAFQQSLKELQDSKREVDLNKRQKAGIFHEGFDYFAEEFGFDPEIEIFSDENQEPSAKELAEAIQEAKEDSITLFFAADDHGKEIAQSIASEVNGKVIVLNPITTGEMEKGAYKKAMEENIAALKEALSQ